MAANHTEAVYCGTDVDNFHTGYKQWHGYISLVVCLLGTVANTLNIVVLTRRDMRSPTNAILTGLAVADLAVMIEYIPYTVHDYILTDRLTREQRLTYSWACFVKFHSIFAQVLHTISIWLTVTLAVWRYIAVGYPQKNRMWCGMRTTIITITTAYIVCVLIVSPLVYLISAIAASWEGLSINGTVVRSVPLSQYIIDYNEEMRERTVRLQSQNVSLETTYSTPIMTNSDTNIAVNVSLSASSTTSPSPSSSTSELEVYRNITVYRLYHSELALHNRALVNGTYLIYSVLIKLIPCTALTILSMRLIAALLEAKRRRKMLTSNAANGMKPLVNGKPVERARKNSKTLEKEKQTDRTTRMLLAVLLLFLITEFPQGIMGLLNTVLGEAFFMECYLKLSDLMDILALINSSINFILYCSMSRQFRNNFARLFRPKFLNKWLPVAQDETGGTLAGGGRCQGDMISKSVAVDQQYQTTQVTNV